jgi:hypothetical protein
MTEAAGPGREPDDEGGVPACGRLADEDPPTTCPACGAELLPD